VSESKRVTAEERFVRRNAMFRFWRSWPATIGALAGYGAFLALTAWAHWNMLAAGGLVIGAGIAGRVIADIWPRKVPAGLASEVARLQAAGCRLRRRHLFLCTEKRPHAHLVMRDGTALTVIFSTEAPPPGSGIRKGRKPAVVVERWRRMEDGED
jgi:hypothetical protein